MLEYWVIVNPYNLFVSRYMICLDVLYLSNNFMDLLLSYITYSYSHAYFNKLINIRISVCKIRSNLTSINLIITSQNNKTSNIMIKWSNLQFSRRNFLNCSSTSINKKYLFLSANHNNLPSSSFWFYSKTF